MAKTKRHKFKVGDLVKIAPWCINKHRQAIVVRTVTWDSNRAWVHFLDGQPDPNRGVTAPFDGPAPVIVQNLILLSAA